jgi:hypothetical protein
MPELTVADPDKDGRRTGAREKMKHQTYRNVEPNAAAADPCNMPRPAENQAATGCGDISLPECPGSSRRCRS